MKIIRFTVYRNDPYHVDTVGRVVYLRTISAVGGYFNVTEDRAEATPYTPEQAEVLAQCVQSKRGLQAGLFDWIHGEKLDILPA